jgi:hypothetical protein
MICWYCTEKFLALDGIFKCKLTGGVLTSEQIEAKKPCLDCPLEPRNEKQDGNMGRQEMGPTGSK